jgi:hypothetical protein
MVFVPKNKGNLLNEIVLLNLSLTKVFRNIILSEKNFHAIFHIFSNLFIKMCQVSIVLVQSNIVSNFPHENHAFS